jgi:putative flippase GtrA
MIKQHVKNRRKHIREVIVYGMVGVSALVVQDIIYWVCHHYFGVFPSIAMIIGSAGGMLIAYFGHVKYTFKKHRYSLADWNGD